jgi:hypothetical protein
LFEIKAGPTVLSQSPGRRKGDLRMWKWRVFGLVLAGGGAALMAFLWSQVLDRSDRILFIHRAGIPADLLLAMVSLCAVLIGLHLLLRPKALARRLTPRAPKGA